MPSGRPVKPLLLASEEESKLELLARRPKTELRTARADLRRVRNALLYVMKAGCP